MSHPCPPLIAASARPPVPLAGWPAPLARQRLAARAAHRPLWHGSLVLALTAALPLGAWAAGAAEAAARRQAPAGASHSVATAVAQVGAAGRAWQLDGVLQPVQQATLAAQVGGSVLQLAVKPGDSLRAGQLVARVDARDAQAALAGSQAGVAQANAQRLNAQQQADRTRALRQQGFVSQAAQDQTDAALRAAQAALQQAQAGQQQAALARGYTTLSAPFDAVVLATHVEVGDLATPGRAIATVYQPGALRAVVQVPASLADAARQAQQVQVQLQDGQRLTPQTSQLLPTADAVSQTVEWRLNLPPTGPGGAVLRPGQAVRVSWTSTPAAGSGRSAGAASPAAAAATGQVPVLPPGAVLRRGELTAVYVAQGQQFVLRAVRVGPAAPSAPSALGALGAGAASGASSPSAGPAQPSAGIPVLAGLKPGERYALDAVAAGLLGAVPAP